MFGKNWNNMKDEEEKQEGQPVQKPTMGGNNFWRLFLWLILLLAIIPWFWGSFSGSLSSTEVNYSTFREQVKAGNVEQVTITGDQIEGQFKEPLDTDEATGEGEDGAAGPTEFITYLPSFGDEELLSLLEAEEVAVQTEPVADSSWWVVLVNLLPFFLIIGIGYFIFMQMRRQGQNMLSVGQSKARRYEPEAEEERTTFDDIAGARGAKTELEEIIEFLKHPERFQRLGGETPRGILLVGPPGTGKTLLARAVAGEADVPFFNISGSDFMEMFVGVGASRVRNMFEEAKKAAPCIIFIDEMDSIGRRRGAGLGGGHDEREQTLNQLLSELDGFDPNENVIVIAATNRPDILDPALLRPGRFDRRITVDLPTIQSREKILAIHARNKPLANIDLKKIAQGTPGFSGADLKNMLNEAALLAARKNKNIIELEDIEAARDKILMGLEREGMVLTDTDRELIAYHEAGHAVIAAVLPDADPVHKVTIIPRGRAMGVTQQLPEQEKYVYPRTYLVDRLAVMMGGRAAENLVLETATSGAENDLKQATQLARKMVLAWGMSERLGRVAWGEEREQVFLGEEIAQRRNYSETTAREIDEEVKAILDEAFQRATDTLQTHRQGLDRIAQRLIEEEEIMGRVVLELLGLDPQEADHQPAPPSNNGNRPII